MIFEANIPSPTRVMPDFMSGIHDFIDIIVPFKAWMAGTSPAMTVVDDAILPPKNFTL